MTKSYQDRYTWTNGINIPDSNIQGLEHSDGSVSVAFSWNGFSTELKPQEKIQHFYNALSKALSMLPESKHLIIENHFLRSFDDSTCIAYLEYGKKNMMRHHDFGSFIREDIAKTTAELAMSNQILTVVTLRRSISPLDAVLPKRAHNKTKVSSLALLNIAREYATNFLGADFLSYNAFEAKIWEHYHRDRGREKSIPSTNSRFKLSQRIADKPEWKNGLLKLGRTYTKVALMLDYDDAGPNWFYQIANRHGFEIHVTQIINPSNSATELIKSSSQTRKALESANKIGGESEQGKISDHNSFRKFVADNNLGTFNNAYIIKIHHIDENELREFYRKFKTGLGANIVFSDSSEEVAFTFWRCSQVAQGHKTTFLRPDHTLQVANMAPVIRFFEGDKKTPQMLRITSDAQAITLSFPEGGTNHQSTAAKTGGGKGVNTTAQICELFPLGVNFYIAEVGPTYKWTVEAFGGSYFHLDPNTTVISPFPDYSMANMANPDMPLPADIVSPTIGALMPLLAKEKDKGAHHISSVAEQMMQALYSLHDNNDKAPSLADFYNISELAKDEFTGAQHKAAITITENLDSFLSSTAGSRFTQSDTLDFNSGIVGVDFKPLMNNEELAKFMLVFIALRFKQLAFANATPTRITLDEQHEFLRIDRDLVITLVNQLTRMGRKEAGAYHGISQEIKDIGAQAGILNQLTHREFMFTQDGHKEIAEMFKMNSAALNIWQSYKDPEASGSDMPFRQCLRMVGEDAFDLHLKYPSSLLDLANSSPKALALKNEIGLLTKDPIERLRLFKERLYA